MADQIDSRGTCMSVRPMTEAEQKRWPDGEVAFTIHYGEGGVKAHALTTVEHAEQFAKTIEEVCRDVRHAKEPRDELGLTRLMRAAAEASMAFVRCECGEGYVLKPRFIVDDRFFRQHRCPKCAAVVPDVCEEIPFAEGWKSRGEFKMLLPAGVTRHGEGRDTYYTGLDGKRITRED